MAPTLDMYEGTDRALATAYWHWFFLIQPQPIPERLIEADPRAYVEAVMGGRHAGLGPFTPRILDEYVADLTGPGAAHGLCEDYRAAATIDLEHDRADRQAGRLIETPLRVLWGAHGRSGIRFRADPRIPAQAQVPTRCTRPIASTGATSPAGPICSGA